MCTDASGIVVAVVLEPREAFVNSDLSEGAGDKHQIGQFALCSFHDIDHSSWVNTL